MELTPHQTSGMSGKGICPNKFAKIGEGYEGPILFDLFCHNVLFLKWTVNEWRSAFISWI
jgi:hypothetical protein